MSTARKHPPKVRTLGLHGYRGLGGYNDAAPKVKAARTRATNAAKRLAKAKAAYRQSRTTAEETAA